MKWGFVGFWGGNGDFLILVGKFGYFFWSAGILRVFVHVLGGNFGWGLCRLRGGTS